jgi:hypothetical protein
VRPSLAVFAIALIGLLSPVHAGPPPAAETGEGADETGALADETGDSVEPPVLLDETTGFWLSVELIGPRGAQVDAAAELVDESVEATLPRGGRPPPGELVGRVANLEQAIRWIDRHAFGEAAIGFEPRPVDRQAERPTPIPGGPLYTKHGVVTTALVVTAAGDSGGTREYPWPSAGMLPTPVDSDWRAAELIAARIPMFAAPAPFVPPVSERYLELGSTSEVWVLGTLDRCDDAFANCLRWNQVIAREGDRFLAGWVPGFHAVPFAAWQHDDSIAGRPRRFALVEGHREPGKVGYVLLEREGQGPTRTTGFVIDHVGRDWPSATLTLLSGTLTVTIAGKVVEQRELAAPPLAPLPPAPAPTPALTPP